MPICNKPAQALSAKTSATEVDDHASEAAKMKRTREQAYFNSYDFDAIEVLPYDDDDDDEGAHHPAAEGEGGRKPPLQYGGHPTLLMGQAASGMNSSRRWLATSPNVATTTAKTTATTSSAVKPPTHPSSSSLSAAQQQQPKHSSKAANSSATANSVASSSRSSSGSTASTGTDDARYSMMKYSYLQRLGAFLIKSQQDRAADDDDDEEAGVDVAEMGAVTAHATVAVNGPEPPNDHDSGPDDMPHTSGNFLLPRAMLKYQSANSMPVASGSGAVTPSSPRPAAPPSSAPATPSLAAVAAAAATAIGQGNRQQFGTCNNNNNGPNKPSAAAATAQPADDHKAAPVARMMITATNSSNNNINTNPSNNNNNNLSKTITMNGNGALKSPATTYPDGHVASTAVATVAAATATTPSAGVLAKKLSTSSTLTTTTSTSAESESEASRAHHAKAPQPPHHADASAKGIALTPLAPRGRTGSHQSHYSTTDKSGSSGYYSSNVCSTYSLDDHIYCEPHIDILEVSAAGQAKGMLKSPCPIGLVEIHQPASPQQHGATAVSRARDMNLAGSSSGGGQTAKQQLTLSADDGDNDDDDDDDDDDDEGIGNARRVAKPQLFTAASPIHFSEQLRVLESSIENLDRHLKNFPGALGPQEHIVSFVQTAYNHQPQHLMGDLLRPYHHLPTIMEGLDQQQQQQQLHRHQQKGLLTAANSQQQWRHDHPDGGPDDSLMDIDLDSFLLVNERQKHPTKHQQLQQQQQHKKLHRVGIDNPSFLTDEQEENHYKCAKYINSCPEDAYRVESDIVAPGTANGTLKSSTMDQYHKRYEDQLHFQNTRELLEDVRDKIRLLSHVRVDSLASYDTAAARSQKNGVPRELEGMIKTLQSELDSYLSRMNRHSELEIRQLYSGMVKNQNVVKMKKAFERRRSLAAAGGESDFSAYEAIQDGILVSSQGVPLSIRQQITSIRCASDPNFKMKRKSLAEIFPIGQDFAAGSRDAIEAGPSMEDVARSQLQRNLSYHKPVLNNLDSQIGGPNGGGGGIGNEGSSGGSSGGVGGEKDSISEWHSKKPSIWEMYYGTNRLNQSLLGKQRSGMVLNPPSQGTMSYPSSRPESDFTLDLPRAEQLRIKMAKEKKFRQRCRFITTFLSLVFFLLTVMVVSLVLTRGKRMFGSMI